MFSQFMHANPLPGRRRGTLALCVIALTLAACSNSITATATPNPLMRGQWTPPAFAGLTAPVAALTFADGNQKVGYACTAVMTATTSTTPIATSGTTPTVGTSSTPPTLTSGTTSTPTLPVPGKPTQSPTVNNLQNAFWRTADGGLTWQAATLPANPANLLCPVSAIVAADVGNPNDVFFLAASGSLNLTQPTSILPGQLQYQLWRSQDGAQTWQQLAVPIAPNPLTPAIIEPYHLVIVANGQTIALASNQSGANALFTSGDGGKTWTQRLAPTPATGTTAGTYNFAGFAAGPNDTLAALVMNTTSGVAAPYAVWQSGDNGDSWRALGAITFTPTAGASTQTQLFAGPGGHMLYVLASTASASSAASATTNVWRSTDAGANWTALGWPKTQAADNTALGVGDIATLGANFAVDAAGNAYIAPPMSDTPLAQDLKAQDSAGFYAAPLGATTWSIIAPPKANGAMAIGLTVSAVIPPTGTTTPTVEAAVTVTATAVVTSTAVSATGTPVASVSTPASTSVATTGTPAIGLPTLWTNFGPLTQLGQQPATTGLFLNVLP